MAEDHRTWDVHVAEFQFALNSVDHDAIGLSPAEIIFNRKIIDPLGNNIPSMKTSDTTYLHKLELVKERIKRLFTFQMLKRTLVQSWHHDLKDLLKLLILDITR